MQKRGFLIIFKKNQTLIINGMEDLIKLIKWIKLNKRNIPLICYNR